MTKKERVISALKHIETDMIPFHMDFTEQAYEKLANYLEDKNFLDNMGLHLNYTQYCGYPTEISAQKDFFLDDFGVTWNRSGADKDIGVVEAPFAIDLENYSFPKINLNEARLRAEYEELLKSKGERFSFTGIGFSMFERAWSLCGMENLLMGMLLNPLETEQLFDDICDYNMKILDIALEYNFDGIYFGDDWGQQKGLIMGGNHWRHFIKPRMKKMYQKVKKSGKYILQHSCGDIEEIFPDLIEIGLDCYQTFQPEIYDIEKVKQKYGSDLTFWGGISTQQLLPYATPEEVQKETVRIMNIMRKNGGFVAAPTHALAFDVPCENILAMLTVFQNQEKYLF